MHSDFLCFHWQTRRRAILYFQTTYFILCIYIIYTRSHFQLWKKALPEVSPSAILVKVRITDFSPMKRKKHKHTPPTGYREPSPGAILRLIRGFIQQEDSTLVQALVAQLQPLHPEVGEANQRHPPCRNKAHKDTL